MDAIILAGGKAPPLSNYRHRIAINGTFSHANPTGLGVHTHELLCELLKIPGDKDLLVYSGSRELKALYPEKVSLVNRHTSPALGFKGHILRLLWQQTVLPYKLRKQKADMLYSTVPEGILNSAIRQVITVHDILPLKYPDIYPRMKYHFYYNLPVLLKNAHAIVCVSENTKKDVISYYGVKDKSIHVIYNGYDNKRFYPREKGAMKKKYGLLRYLLYVGDMRPYKNLERSIEAFAILNPDNTHFVIAGGKDKRFYPSIKNKVDALGLTDRVIFPGYVPQEDLPHLYSDAAMLVFPSLYEGFGLPPLEAMACGCPVLTSRTTSLPEVCGEAAVYVDPYSAGSIAEGMKRMLADDEGRARSARKGLERAKLFSWEKTAKETMRMLENCVAAISACPPPYGRN